MTETKQRIEVVLIPGEPKPLFSVGKFLRRYLKPLVILSVAGVLIGIAGAAFYWVSVSRAAAQLPPAQGAEQAEAEHILEAPEMEFLAAKLVKGDTNYVEFSYLLEEELAYAEGLAAKVSLMTAPDGFAEMPKQIAQIQAAIARNRTKVDDIHDLIAESVLLTDEDPNAVRDALESNQLAIDIYLDELERAMEDPSAGMTSASEIAGMRMEIEKRKMENKKLEAILRGEAPYTLAEQAAADAVRRRLDSGAAFLNETKAELLEIVQKCDEAARPLAEGAQRDAASPSGIMALGILLAVAVGVFAAGLVVLLMLNDIRNAEKDKGYTSSKRELS